MILQTAEAIKYAEGFEKHAAEIFKEPATPLTAKEEVVLYHIFQMFHRDPIFKEFITDATTAFSSVAADCNCPNCQKEKEDGT